MGPGVRATQWLRGYADRVLQIVFDRGSREKSGGENISAVD